ncbi:MAG TPA: GTPase HflX, partial [Acidobacteria bacterium]|nr:GTPase HflX [Acidobacteriota bacterium]
MGGHEPRGVPAAGFGFAGGGRPVTTRAFQPGLHFGGPRRQGHRGDPRSVRAGADAASPGGSALTVAAGREPSDRERAVLVGVAHGGLPRSEVEDHLDELGRLVDTAGGQAVARLVQERREIDPATLVGSGFVGQIAEACTESGARTVVFDEDLTGSQVRNLEQGLPKDIKVLDRAGVILDIFAQRARTREAQTQVELAQLTYLLSRLTRRWRHLSRQAGGIGTRGVGETQLELDRRLITRRITQLRKKLSEIEATRRLRRQRRTTVPTVALVGYTNAGKSSLFRRLTRARVLVEDR